SALAMALKYFDKAGRPDLAAQVIEDNVQAIEDPKAKTQLFERLGELREKEGQPKVAGEAFAQAAEIAQTAKLWEAAERCFVAGEEWQRAAFSVGQRAELVADEKARATLLVRASSLLSKGGDEDNALLYLEGASVLDPDNDAYALAVERR